MNFYYRFNETLQQNTKHSKDDTRMDTFKTGKLCKIIKILFICSIRVILSTYKNTVAIFFVVAFSSFFGDFRFTENFYDEEKIKETAVLKLKRLNGVNFIYAEVSVLFACKLQCIVCTRSVCIHILFQF